MHLNSKSYKLSDIDATQLETSENKIASLLEGMFEKLMLDCLLYFFSICG